MKIKILSLFIFCLATMACDKDKHGPDLPPITTTGANTFGCRINGKVWVPSKRPKGDLPQIEGGIVTRYDSIGPEKNWYDLLIFAYREDLTGFQIFLRRINSIGQYQLFFTPSEFPSCVDCSNSYGYYYTSVSDYKSLPIVESSVNLTQYDTINKIFSGNFSFVALNKNGGDSIFVTDGRFDINQFKIN